MSIVSPALTIPHTVSSATTAGLLSAIYGRIVVVDLPDATEIRGRLRGSFPTDDPDSPIAAMIFDPTTSRLRRHNIPLGSVVHVESGPLADI